MIISLHHILLQLPFLPFFLFRSRISLSRQAPLLAPFVAFCNYRRRCSSELFFSGGGGGEGLETGIPR